MRIQFPGSPRPAPGVPTRLPMVSVSVISDGSSVLHMPAPRAAVRHAIPMIFEGILAPIVIFYLALIVVGFRGALLAALAWSAAALVRRIVGGGRVSGVLALGVALLALRTLVAFVTRSADFYFVPPMAWSVLVSLVLIGSAIVRRPFTQRFADDFCPLDPALLRMPRVQQFFVRVSILWATVLLVNTGLAFWLLMSSSLKAFVLERTVAAWVLTTGAIAGSIFGFTATMRSDGIAVQWGMKRHEEPVLEAA